MIPNFDRLRLMNMYGGFGQPADDGSDDGSMDYSPDAPSINTNLPSKWTAAPVEDVPSGQSPQNPFAAQIFRQSMEPNQPDTTPKTETDWAAKYRDLYHPSNVAQDRFNKLLDNFPEEEKPTFMRKFAASLAGVGKGGLKDAQFILDEPNRSALERFKTQATPFEKAADNERQSNINERTIAQQTIAAQQNQQKIDETARKDRETAAAKQQANELMAAKQNGYTFTVVGNHYIAHMPDGTTFDTGYDAKNHTPIEVATITAGSREKVAAGQNATKEVVAGINQTGANQRSMDKATTTLMAPDENGNMVPWAFNPVTKTYERYKNAAGDQATGPVYKPGAQSSANDPNALTVQTRNQIQGARALLPQVTDVSEIAAQLQKNGQFGVAMSRLRNAAAKLGTTGDYQEDAKTLAQISSLIDSKEFNPDGDFTLGQFQAALGGLASGVARVHSRTGGSMGMINHFKALLDPTSTYDMFNGRLFQIQKLLKDYATQGGPAPTKKVPIAPPGLDDALNKIFGKPQGD